MKGIKFILVFLLLCIGFACRDLYDPGLVSSNESYLVVEGVLNAGAGPTNLRLTRTFKLDDSATVRGEVNAMVTVEGKDNTTRQLTMNGDGTYASPNLNLVLNQEYRLRIVTANGKEYLSEYVMAKKTPLIDSVSFRQNDKGVQIYVTTHDNTNNTRYYFWNFDETWEIRSYYFASYKYENGDLFPVLRTSAEYVSTCWKYDNSHDILIGTSAQYQIDSLPEAPVNFIGNGDERLAERYSTLIRQYALDKKGYEFFELMKKNTESLGTIFDAQPSQVKGNIYSVSDPREPVIGYVSASTIEEKRIFIEKTDLYRWRFTQNCLSYKIANDPDSIRAAHDGGAEVYEAATMGIFIIGWWFSDPPCVDCTRRGGSLIRPSYW
jgi:hypothetical protein